jgi:hypothetical protein
METVSNPSPSKPHAASLRAAAAVVIIGVVAFAVVWPAVLKGGNQEAHASASAPALTLSDPAVPPADVDYFPSRFAAPKGDVAVIPDTF